MMNFIKLIFMNVDLGTHRELNILCGCFLLLEFVLLNMLMHNDININSMYMKLHIVNKV